MLDRRTFIGNGLFANILPFVGIKVAHDSIRKPDGENPGKDYRSDGPSIIGNIPARIFISHRGLNLKMTIAGDNSIESARLAKRCGFDAIEFDLRLTSDGQWVVMHDETLNRTSLNLDGSEIIKKELVADKTLDELKTKFVLRAKEVRNRSLIPTLNEFLLECKRLSLLPFLHIKEENLSEESILGLIRQCDGLVGRGKYIITSNNNLNKAIRKIGIEYMPLMGILYQTTFEEIENWSNSIMAISVSRFTIENYHTNVRRANLLGIPVESSADNFERFGVINEAGIDVISTDLLAPDLKNDSSLIVRAISDGTFDEYSFTGKLVNGTVVLKNNDSLKLKAGIPKVYLGAIYLSIEVIGECDVELANQKFKIKNSMVKEYSHQIMVYDESPHFKLSTKENCVVKQISIKIARF